MQRNGSSKVWMSFIYKLIKKFSETENFRVSSFERSGLRLFDILGHML